MVTVIIRKTSVSSIYKRGFSNKPVISSCVFNDYLMVATLLYAKVCTAQIIAIASLSSRLLISLHDIRVVVIVGRSVHVTAS